ncbi:ankyrin repeat domain-containing protein [Nocardia sp. NPDC049190]|uniref:ankyrin repeat domain-containing protein n=1 Tax=Nocardia sp. NPDC049190 TaxID=3155650 RepID=UPI0033F3E513
MADFPDSAVGRVADAIARDSRVEVASLLREGADPGAVGSDGASLLEWAIYHRSRGSFEVLLDAGADVRHTDHAGDTVMHYAAIADDSGYLTELITRGAEVDIVNRRNGHTPLMDAVMHRRHANIRLLLAAGVDPDRTDHVGDTPLHMAGEINDYRTIMDLLDAGADPTLNNRQGATFQRYIFMTSAMLLTEHARAERDQIIGWLREHDIPVESP